MLGCVAAVMAIGVAVATEARGDPEDIDFRDRLAAERRTHRAPLPVCTRVSHVAAPRTILLLNRRDAHTCSPAWAVQVRAAIHKALEN